MCNSKGEMCDSKGEQTIDNVCALLRDLPQSPALRWQQLVDVSFSIFFAWPQPSLRFCLMQGCQKDLQLYFHWVRKEPEIRKLPVPAELAAAGLSVRRFSECYVGLWYVTWCAGLWEAGKSFGRVVGRDETLCRICCFRQDWAGRFWNVIFGKLESDQTLCIKYNHNLEASFPTYINSVGQFMSWIDLFVPWLGSRPSCVEMAGCMGTASPDCKLHALKRQLWKPCMGKAPSQPDDGKHLVLEP